MNGTTAPVVSAVLALVALHAFSLAPKHVVVPRAALLMAVVALVVLAMVLP